MPALPADIAAASRDVASATWSDATIAGRYPSARDASSSTPEGYFDAIGDAATAVTARGAIVGTERRRFTVAVADTVWPTVSTGLPQIHLVDSEQAVGSDFLVARFELDLEAETSTYELFG